MFDILFLALAGTLAGILTGFVPGIHPNTLAGFILVFSPALTATFTTQAVLVFIVTMAIAHTFINFIPSVYLGAPEGETALSVLPGHHMLLEGRGYEAVYLTAVGGIGVIVFSITLLPLVILILPTLYFHIRAYIAYLLILVAVLMILSEHGEGKLSGFAVFMLAGLLGILSLSPTFSSPNILFPVFTGLFGISTLLISLRSGMRVPEQCLRASPVGRGEFLGVVKGFLSGLFVGILPGMGASQASILVHHLTRGKSAKEFMVALGGINTVAALFSLMSLYLISRPRSGVAIAVQQLAGNLGLSELLLLVAATAFASGISATLTLKLAKYFSSLIMRINYSTLLLTVIIFLIIAVVALSGPSGLLVLATSTAIGILPPLFGVKRTHAMGVLMVPIIMFYLNFPGG